MGSGKRGHGGVMSGYPTSMSVPWVDGLSTDHWVLGLHNIHHICDMVLTCNGKSHCICTETSHFMGVSA